MNLQRLYTSLIAAVGLTAAPVVLGSPQTVEVWVVLSEPALASLPRDAAASERAELRRRIERQQDDIMAQLAALGAVESARIQNVRNAIAVRLPPAAIESAKKIQGVTGVHAISHRNRIHD
ncbi:MAG: hypothetical protein ACREXP_02440 [Steroidobacteraceae bacterium]